MGTGGEARARAPAERASARHDGARRGDGPDGKPSACLREGVGGAWRVSEASSDAPFPRGREKRRITKRRCQRRVRNARDARGSTRADPARRPARTLRVMSRDAARAKPRVDVQMARVRAVRSRARRMTRTHRGGRRDRAGNRAGSGDGVRHAVVNAETLCVCDVRLPSSKTLGRSVGRARPWGGASEGVRAN